MISKLAFKLPDALVDAVRMNVAEWHAAGNVRRLWQGDASLWTGADESKWLGWLGIVEDQIAHRDSLARLADEIKHEGFADVLLLGLGGSSLCSEVLAKTFGHIPGFPRLHVLDSTDPAHVKAFENQVDLAKTLCIVSSKSGSTLEPNIFKQYFFERVKQTVGADKAGSRFVAVTDPGSKMQQVAERDWFRHIFYGVPSIGGRYSALSNFGMVPAATMGLDVGKFLDRTHEMVTACGASVPVEENPGVMLGIILGTAARNRRDKVTIITSPGISDLGAWLEQLLAESTGKQGEGIIPVDREDLGPPNLYGNDRLFVYLRLDSATDAQQDADIAALARAGQPVVRISLSDVYDLGQEFFRWEIATAVAGSIIGINAFNQPDVKLRVATLLEDDGIKLFTDPRNAQALANAAGKGKSLAAYLRAHLKRIEDGDYFALLAYIPMNEANEARLQEMRHALRDRKYVATCVGFGPRFLHSTGQAYKGGPNSGVFLQVTCDDAADLPVPGQKYSFGVVKAAQARGDFQVLAERGRRALRVHLPKDVSAGLSKLREAFRQALG